MEYSIKEIARMELADLDALEREGAEKILEGLKLLDEARETCRYKADLYREKAEQMGGRMCEDALPLILASGEYRTEANELLEVWIAVRKDNLYETLLKMAGRKSW